MATLAESHGSVLGATLEPGEPAHAGRTGGRSVWWTWTAPASGPVAVDTLGSGFDTTLAVYEGESLAALTEVAANADIRHDEIVASFVMGSDDLYTFVDDNPMVEMHPSHYVNDAFIIAQNERMVSINSALSIDLSGQACADSVGYDVYSGTGGQADFVRGANRSKGGKSILALPSTAKGGVVSRICGDLLRGSGVTTSRSDIHFVVTEYGVAELKGKNLRERVKALVSVAHPKFRDGLLASAREQRWI